MRGEPWSSSRFGFKLDLTALSLRSDLSSRSSILDAPVWVVVRSRCITTKARAACCKVIPNGAPGNPKGREEGEDAHAWFPLHHLLCIMELYFFV